MSKFVTEDAELHLTPNDLRRALEYWINGRVVGDRVNVTNVKLMPGSAYAARLTIRCADPPKPVAIDKKAS